MRFLTLLTLSALSSGVTARPYINFEEASHELLMRRQSAGTNSSSSSTCSSSSSIAAAATYSGKTYTNGTEVRLRITNGGAGQSGLVGALAQAYIDYSITNGTATTPYLIDWVTGDTTDSIDYIQNGDADIAMTYNPQAEYSAGNSSISVRREYGWRDHFYLLGPSNNTANLSSSDDVLSLFNKIVTSANANNGTRFLTRFDKSATNIKESLLFATIGQIPWAHGTTITPSWYHAYTAFPIQALTAASLLGEYTLSDRGTYLTLQAQNANLTDALVLYKRGEDTDPTDMLLNPASVLLGSKVCSDNLALAQGFMDWMISPSGGQAVVSNYSQPGTTEVLYTAAPNCTTQPEACYGW